MVKISIYLKIVILVITGSVRALAQENLHPDKNAIDLLNATQSINYFADSLNLISRPDQLPKVLSDYLLDWKITKGICVYVTPINFSFRKAILDRVVREDVLQWIIDSKNTAYDALYDPVKVMDQNKLSTMIYHPEKQGYCELPFMKLSIRDLAKVRLATLRANKQRIDRGCAKKELDKKMLEGNYCFSSRDGRDSLFLTDRRYVHRYYSSRESKRFEATGTWRYDPQTNQVTFEDFIFYNDEGADNPPGIWHSTVEVAKQNEVRLLYAPEHNVYYYKK